MIVLMSIQSSLLAGGRLSFVCNLISQIGGSEPLDDGLPFVAPDKQFIEKRGSSLKPLFGSLVTFIFANHTMVMVIIFVANRLLIQRF